jgi:hypothetical protein
MPNLYEYFRYNEPIDESSFSGSSTLASIAGSNTISTKEERLKTAFEEWKVKLEAVLLDVMDADAEVYQEAINPIQEIRQLSHTATRQVMELLEDVGEVIAQGSKTSKYGAQALQVALQQMGQLYEDLEYIASELDPVTPSPPDVPPKSREQYDRSKKDQDKEEKDKTKKTAKKESEESLTEPSTYVNKFPGGEEKWKKAKELASKQGRSEDYAYITGIFKKMVGENVDEGEHLLLGTRLPHSNPKLKNVSLQNIGKGNWQVFQDKMSIGKVLKDPGKKSYSWKHDDTGLQSRSTFATHHDASEDLYYQHNSQNKGTLGVKRSFK